MVEISKKRLEAVPRKTAGVAGALYGAAGKGIYGTAEFSRECV